MFLNECDDGTDKWGFDGIYPEPETIVKVFSWAQWDCLNQVNNRFRTALSLIADVGYSYLYTLPTLLL